MTETILAQLVHMLHTMHSQGFVHRDIKLENLMISCNKVVLLDLGLSSHAGEEPILGGGSIEYMTPISLIKGGCAKADPSDDW